MKRCPGSRESEAGATSVNDCKRRPSQWDNMTVVDTEIIYNFTSVSNKFSV